jgi:hypothetical protein
MNPESAPLPPEQDARSDELDGVLREALAQARAVPAPAALVTRLIERAAAWSAATTAPPVLDHPPPPVVRGRRRAVVAAAGFAVAALTAAAMIGWLDGLRSPSPAPSVVTPGNPPEHSPAAAPPNKNPEGVVKEEARPMGKLEPVAADPPPLERTMPGHLRGQMASRWLAPYVHYSWIVLGDQRVTSVRWLTPDGKVRRELTGPRVDPVAGYLSDVVDGQLVIWGVNQDWKLVLPRREGAYITTTPNGSRFLHQYQPELGQIAGDLYAGGKRLATVGPFRQYESWDMRLGADGSLALLTWKDDAHTTAQVVAASADGTVRMQVDCGHPVMSPVVAPDARGVLVQPNGDDRNTFRFYTAKGLVAAVTPGPNADHVTWLPHSEMALMSSSLGHSHRFHLVDFSTGKQLWDIPDPCSTRVPGLFPQVIAAGDYLLFAGREYLLLGGDQAPVQSLYAVEIRTGKTVARWYPAPLQPCPERDEPWFFQDGPRLYVMTPREFSELDLDDIAARKRGWK